MKIENYFYVKYSCTLEDLRQKRIELEQRNALVNIGIKNMILQEENTIDLIQLIKEYGRIIEDCEQDLKNLDAEIDAFIKKEEGQNEERNSD